MLLIRREMKTISRKSNNSETCQKEPENPNIEEIQVRNLCVGAPKDWIGRRAAQNEQT